MREMRTDNAPKLPAGTVAVDETYAGGKNKYCPASKKTKEGERDKTPAAGVLERKGNVSTYVVEETTSEVL